MEAIGLLVGGRAARHGDREVAQSKSQEVGEHVAGIAEQRQGIGEYAADDLRRQYDTSDSHCPQHPVLAQMAVLVVVIVFMQMRSY